MCGPRRSEAGCEGARREEGGHASCNANVHYMPFAMLTILETQ